MTWYKNRVITKKGILKGTYSHFVNHFKRVSYTTAIAWRILLTETR